MTAPGNDDHREMRALKLALLLSTIAVLLALPLLFKETAINFVVFMFLGPVLLLVAALALGWVILRDLRSKKVL